MDFWWIKVFKMRRIARTCRERDRRVWLVERIEHQEMTFSSWRAAADDNRTVMDCRQYERSSASIWRLSGTNLASLSRYGPAAVRKDPTSSCRSGPLRPMFRRVADGSADGRLVRCSAEGHRRRRGGSTEGQRCLQGQVDAVGDRRRRTDELNAVDYDADWAGEVAADDVTLRTVQTSTRCPVTSRQVHDQYQKNSLLASGLEKA